MHFVVDFNRWEGERGRGLRGRGRLKLRKREEGW
jgi:hypothetical protein